MSLDQAGASDQKRRKSRKLADPESYFKDWAYQVGREHFSLLGVEYMVFMERRKPVPSWAIWEPIEFECLEGSIFYRRDNPSLFLQIFNVWDAFRVEVHEGSYGVVNKRMAWAVAPKDVLIWLETGVRSESAFPIDVANSRSGLMAWQITRT